MEDKFFNFEFEGEKTEPTEKTRPALPVNPVMDTGPMMSAPINRPLSRPNEGQQELAESRSDLAQQNDHEVSERTKQLLEANRGLIMRAFPGKTQKLILEKERLMVGTMLDFRVKLLHLSTQFKLEAMRDRYDVALKGYKAQNRVAMIQFFLTKFNELNQSVKEKEFEGLQQIIGMYRNANSIEIPTMRAKYIERISQREDQYMAVVDKLLRSFEVILDEHLMSF